MLAVSPTENGASELNQLPDFGLLGKRRRTRETADLLEKRYPQEKGDTPLASQRCPEFVLKLSKRLPLPAYVSLNEWTRFYKMERYIEQIVEKSRAGKGRRRDAMEPRPGSRKPEAKTARGRYDALLKKLDELERRKDEANEKRNRIETFIASLRERGEPIAGFDEELFNVMVEKAVVNWDGSIEFVFHSGYSVKVAAGE